MRPMRPRDRSQRPPGKGLPWRLPPAPRPDSQAPSPERVGRPPVRSESPNDV
jgi:hypothetical protein